MSDYRRMYVEGATYFFTVNTFHRRAFLTTDLARSCLHEALAETRQALPFNLDAICLLPDHLHCLWTMPDEEVDFSTRWNRLKGRFSKAYLGAGGADGKRNASRQRSGEAALWQRRFWEHCVRDENDFARHFDYIHYNPVKHEMVTRPEDWAWSTFHKYQKMGWYDKDWGDDEPPSIRGFNCPGE